MHWSTFICVGVMCLMFNIFMAADEESCRWKAATGSWSGIQEAKSFRFALSAGKNLRYPTRPYSSWWSFSRMLPWCSSALKGVCLVTWKTKYGCSRWHALCQGYSHQTPMLSPRVRSWRLLRISRWQRLREWARTCRWSTWRQNLKHLTTGHRGFRYAKTKSFPFVDLDSFCQHAIVFLW